MADSVWRYKVVVKAGSAPVDLSRARGLVREFMAVARAQSGVFTPSYLRPLATQAEKLWTVRGSAYKQYRLACDLGLRAWFIPVRLVEDMSLTETNTGSMIRS